MHPASARQKITSCIKIHPASARQKITSCIKTHPASARQKITSCIKIYPASACQGITSCIKMCPASARQKVHPLHQNISCTKKICNTIYKNNILHQDVSCISLSKNTSPAEPLYTHVARSAVEHSRQTPDRSSTTCAPTQHSMFTFRQCAHGRIKLIGAPGPSAVAQLFTMHTSVRSTLLLTFCAQMGTPSLSLR